MKESGIGIAFTRYALRFLPGGPRNIRDGLTPEQFTEAVALVKRLRQQYPSIKAVKKLKGDR